MGRGGIAKPYFLWGGTVPPRLRFKNLKEEGAGYGMEPGEHAERSLGPGHSAQRVRVSCSIVVKLRFQTGSALLRLLRLCSRSKSVHPGMEPSCSSLTFTQAFITPSSQHKLSKNLPEICKVLLFLENTVPSRCIIS